MIWVSDLLFSTPTHYEEFQINVIHDVKCSERHEQVQQVIVDTRESSEKSTLRQISCSNCLFGDWWTPEHTICLTGSIIAKSRPIGAGYCRSVDYLKKTLSGVHGSLAELARVSPEHFTSVNHVLSGTLRNAIVVENSEIGLKSLKLQETLNRNRILSFIVGSFQIYPIKMNGTVSMIDVIECREIIDLCSKVYLELVDRIKCGKANELWIQRGTWWHWEVNCSLEMERSERRLGSLYCNKSTSTKQFVELKVWRFEKEMNDVNERSLIWKLKSCNECNQNDLVSAKYRWEINSRNFTDWCVARIVIRRIDSIARMEAEWGCLC